MAWAICTACNQVKHWRARTGCRLSDVRCDGCDGPVALACRVGRVYRPVHSGPGPDDLVRKYVQRWPVGPLVARRILDEMATLAFHRHLDEITPSQAWQMHEAIDQAHKWFEPDPEELLA